MTPHPLSPASAATWLHAPRPVRGRRAMIRARRNWPVWLMAFVAGYFVAAWGW